MFWRIALAAAFFNHNLPVLRRKQSAFEIEDLPGLWRIHWRWGRKILLSTFYTRIDQACLLWGMISVLIFGTAQFSLLDWRTQAVIWSGLTLFGTVGMVELARYWRTVEPLSEVINAWVFLMLVGVVMTDLSIFYDWGQILAQLCPLWLVLDAVGYFYTGLKLKSRAFALIGVAHLLGIGILPYVGVWQFLTTGLITGVGALLLAEFQWDSGDVCAHLKANSLDP